MKSNYSKIIFFSLMCISFSMKSQTQAEREVIVKNYDISKLKALRLKYSKDFNDDKNKAMFLAKKNGWKIKYMENGSYHELISVSEEGKPIYYKTDNLDASISTRTNFLHNNGGLGLDIEGQGMTAHVWDGGSARPSHQEYDGVGGDNRFSVGDDSDLSFHGAHVTGTIIASGFVSDAKGMAPQANAIGYDWNNDLAEAAEAALNGMLISNHSYGFRAADIPDWWFGAYTIYAKEWDELMYNSPYYLTVFSAGNDGSVNTTNSDPLDGESQFDKINGNKTSKNSLIIANAQDAQINANGVLESVVRSSSSSEGPMDDLRIKPDLMGNGTQLYSSYESSDNAYNSISGTSMAAPNVTGSLLLLQQYYNETNGVFMKASTLKGLVMHTADDVDIPGPDPHVGWGLLNAKAAAEAITENGFDSYISEESLSNGESFSISVKSDGVSPLLASISWTDKPGQVNTGTSNDTTPALINDLDIKITKDGESFSPWRLTGVYSNEKADNTVDPFERIDIDNPAGEYLITVTHKGTLDENQDFSIIVTGVSSDIAFNTPTSYQKVCSDDDAVFDFSYIQNASGTTTLTSNGVPDGANLVFSSSTLETSGDFFVTINNLEGVLAGEYPIEIIADNGNETKKRKITLKILHPEFSNYEQTISSPTNGVRGVSAASLNLNWTENVNAESYLVEVSKTPSFSSTIVSEVDNSLNFDLNNLESNTVYYWRVRPDNSCGIGLYSEVFSFQTGITECTTFTGTDFTDASIGNIDVDVTAFVPIPVSMSGNSIINSITVTTDITHSRINDLIVYLQEPQELGSNNVLLLVDPCGPSAADITNTTFDDNADAFSCSNATPAISGTIAPQDNLSSTVGKEANGTWFLAMFDQVRFQGGQINAASMIICTSEENTNVPTFSSTDIVLGGSASYTITTDNMNASSDSETDEEQVYTLVVKPNLGSLEKESTLLAVGDTFSQADINSGKIKFVNTQTTTFTDQFVVDIKNSANGWLGNQTISIQEDVLKTDQFMLNNFSFWPNPTKDIINIKLNSLSDKNIVIKIFDIQGRVILFSEEPVEGSIFTKEIDTNNIASGIYILSVSQGNRKVAKKIVVSKE